MKIKVVLKNGSYFGFKYEDAEAFENDVESLSILNKDFIILDDGKEEWTFRTSEIVAYGVKR